MHFQSTILWLLGLTHASLAIPTEYPWYYPDSDDQRLDGRSVDMDNNNADAECCGPAGAWWLGKGLPEGVKADVSQDIIGQASDDLSGTTGELDSRTLNDVLGELTTD